MTYASSVGIPSLVRVSQLGRRDVSHALDMGAAGVMVPMVETADQARLLVQWAKYPPLGRRSYSGGAHTSYGPSGNHATNMAAANGGTLAIVQIETVRGVQNIGEILDVEGVDAAIVGPADLAISMGRPDEVGCKEELALIDEVRDACVARGVAFGIIGGASLVHRYARDITFMVSAIDTHVLRDAFAREVASYKEVADDVR